MKVFNGQEALEIERTEKQMKIFLEGKQVKSKDCQAFETEATVIVKPNEFYALELDYELPKKSVSLAQKLLELKIREERLRLAQKLIPLIEIKDEFRTLFLHPEMIFFKGEVPFTVYSGFLDTFAPLQQDEALLLRQIKALILTTINPKYSFEMSAHGASNLKDEFGERIQSCETVEDINECLTGEITKEHQRNNEGKVYVSELGHRFLLVFSIVAVIAVGISAFFIQEAYSQTIPKQKNIIQAQSDFLTQNYDKTLSDLENYQPADLPSSARYVLAVSSVELSSLTVTQKQAVLNNLSTKSDTNTLNYWIYTGRGKFSEALNLAKNLGDDTLTYLAYYNLYEETKLDTKMGGAKKQELLDKYSKEISQLSKSLGLK